MFTQAELNQQIHDAVEAISYPDCAPRLFDPIRYTLQAGGKRLRPTLVLMAANLYADDVADALPPAIGLELYHNFTLLHDDVMDNAPERRGRPAVHVRWDANTAILSADAMQALAYTYVAQAPAGVLGPVIHAFNRMNLEICEGQQMDMDFETRSDVTVAEYMQMIRLKTSVLLGCALRMGALIGQDHARRHGARPDDADADRLYAIGENLGLAFQLQDDWLDCWGDPATFGKRIGGDILCNKKTFLLITALARADAADLAVLQRELDPRTATLADDAKIACFTDVYRRCGAEAACRDAIERHQRDALEGLRSLHVPAGRTASLEALALGLTHRKS